MFVFDTWLYEFSEHIIVPLFVHILQGDVASLASRFLLIIGMTTASTGVFAQVTAKALYHLILLSALVSLATWILRVRLERMFKQGGGPSSEVIERT